MSIDVDNDDNDDDDDEEVGLVRYELYNVEIVA